MTHFASATPHRPVIELDARTPQCVIGGCRGVIVRHSLGGGQAVDRCTRCFRRYRVRAELAEHSAPNRGLIRRVFDDFVSWRE